MTNTTKQKQNTSPEERLGKLIKIYREIFNNKPIVSFEDGYIQIYFNGYSAGNPIMIDGGTINDCCKMFEEEIKKNCKADIESTISEINTIKKETKTILSEKLGLLKQKQEMRFKLLDELNIDLDVKELDKTLEENK